MPSDAIISLSLSSSTTDRNLSRVQLESHAVSDFGLLGILALCADKCVLWIPMYIHIWFRLMAFHQFAGAHLCCVDIYVFCCCVCFRPHTYRPQLHVWSIALPSPTITASPPKFKWCKYIHTSLPFRWAVLTLCFGFFSAGLMDVTVNRDERAQFFTCFWWFGGLVWDRIPSWS